MKIIVLIHFPASILQFIKWECNINNIYSVFIVLYYLFCNIYCPYWKTLFQWMSTLCLINQFRLHMFTNLPKIPQFYFLDNKKWIWSA